MRHAVVGLALALLSAGLSDVAVAQSVARSLEHDPGLLVCVNDVVQAVDWTFHRTPDGRLLVLCRSDDEALCVPIDLRRTPHRLHDDDLYVAPDALAAALGIQLSCTADGFEVTGKASERTPQTASPLPAVSDDWGPDRGFRPGQTLPDIPLYDMDGNEVRFGRFLGKQAIIYCWASW